MEDMKGIKMTLLALQQSFASRMESFESDLKKTRAQSPTVNSLAAEFDSFRSFIAETLKTIEQQVAAIASDNDAIEMRSRRNILLLHGVPECNDEDTIQTFINLASDHLGSLKLSADVVRKSVRLGRLKQDKARPLLVKFNSDAVRDSVWYMKTAFKGTGITISEFLTRLRHKIFMSTREQLGISNCWTKSGRIIAIDSNGKRRVVESLSDIEDLKPKNSAKSPGPRGNKDSAVEQPAPAVVGVKNRRAASAKRK